MARTLTAASSHYLENTSAVLTAAPLTMACWYKPVATNQIYVLMCLGKVDETQNAFLLYQNSNNTVVAQANDASGAGFAVSTAGASAGIWTLAVGTFTSSSSRASYVDGGSKGTGTDSITPAGINRTLVGARYLAAGTKEFFLDGSVAEAAIWNIALSDAEVAELYVSAEVGKYPNLVRSDALVAYWPLLGNDSPEPDDAGSADLTVSGAVQGTHLTMSSGARFWLMGPLP